MADDIANRVSHGASVTVLGIIGEGFKRSSRSLLGNV